MKIFRNVGIAAILLFSFFYTEKIANLTLEKNEIYKIIKSEKSNYDIEYVNAEINGEYITPGLNGESVNIKDSYFNMKDINIFNSYYLVYDDVYPEISLYSNIDKIINKGNSLKKSVAFVLEYEPKMIDFFKNNGYEASVLVNKDNFMKDDKLEQLNNEIDDFNAVETLINKYSTNTNICYINDLNEDIARKNKKYLVKTDKIVNNSTFLDIKKSIFSGDIYYVDKNMDVKNMQILINSILYKDLDIVRLSQLLSEERD